MKLYTYWRSTAAYRVRIALNLKGLDYRSVPVDLVEDGGEQNKPAYLAINPQGLLPALDVDGHGDAIAQSVAILEYLEERYSAPPLLPAASRDRAVVRGMVQLIACDVHPLNNLRVLKYLKDILQLEKDAVDAWYRHWIAEGLRPLEAVVAAHGSALFCFGDAPSLADVCMVPQLYNAHRFACDLTPYPRLVAIERHLLTLPEFTAAAPECQPDAPN